MSEVPARVVARGDDVFLQKVCPEHGPSEAQVERDVGLYEALCNPGEPPPPLKVASLALNITERCDLACEICYMPNRRRPDLSREVLEERIAGFEGRMIWFTGGEPTSRVDLPRLIDHARRQGKIPVLITNGLKLADSSYACTLKQAGLRWVHFSFNGFNDRAYRCINGAPLLRTKLRALSNLRVLGFSTVLSMLYVRGVNEDQVAPVLRHALASGSAIPQLRIRPARQIHRGGGETVFLSELLERVAATLGVQSADLLARGQPRATDRGLAYLAGRMPCHLDLHLGRYLRRTLAGAEGPRPVAAAAVARWTLGQAGPAAAARIGLSYLTGRGRGADLVIRLRAWPDRHTLDLGELPRCVSGYMPRVGGEPLSFCHALILNEQEQVL